MKSLRILVKSLVLVGSVLTVLLFVVFTGIGENSLRPLAVEIIAPREGERVHGKISIEARVNHPEEVSFVEFYVQEPGAKDRYSWKEYSVPYSWGGKGGKLDTTLFSDGAASAVAFCYSGDSRSPKTEKRVNFIIDNGKPVIKIASPKDGETVTGRVPIRIDAKDLKGITKAPGIHSVYVYLDGTLVQTLAAPPFQGYVDTCLSVPGLHSIRVVAEDSEGLTNADSITVSVGTNQGTHSK